VRASPLPTLLAYRQAVAYALDDLSAHIVTATGTTTTVICTSLVNATTGASGRRLDGQWLYFQTGANAGSGRRVQGAGHVASTGTTTYTPPTTAASGAGDIIELTALFPIGAEAPNVTNYRRLVNAALRKILLHDRISLAATTVQSYSLATWAAWLDRPERLLRVLETGPTAGVPEDASWRQPRLVLDGESPALELATPFAAATGGGLTLSVARPADTWIKPSGGAWGESAVGLAVDADEAQPSVEDVMTATLVEAYQVLATREQSAPTGNRWYEKWQVQREIARSRLRYDDTLERKVEAPSDRADAAIVRPLPGREAA
jgi:hypothetical protein